MGKKKFKKGKSKPKKGLKPESVAFELRLYIADSEINSRKAVDLLQKFCGQYLKEKCSLTIIDVFQDYKSALEDNVLVAPTLIWLKKDTPAFLMGSFEWQDLFDFFGLSESRGGEK
ncbi:MAG: hypothetical protein H5U07_06735 [Candidatus Aminicenantes bacterium]|nr:hypothetical protein [Candidatus Aminicenantes bacterium]